MTEQQSKTSTKNKTLLSLLAFNGLTATAGAYVLMMGIIEMPLSWLTDTSFANFYIPGVILFTIGGLSLTALIAFLKQIDGAGLLSIISGFAMIYWIIGEIASIKEFHWLQAVYLITGLAIIWLTPSNLDNR